MRKLLLLTTFILACASVSFAQGDDYNKVEFAAGYSHARVDTGVDEADLDDDEIGDFFRERQGYNGIDTSITGNLTRYFGVKGNFSAHFRSDTISDFGVTIDTKQRLYNFLGGVQIKDNSKETRVKPFAHFLAGGAHQTAELSSPSLTAETFKVDDTSFALKIGGGIDLRIHPRVDLRLIELNYNPVFVGDQDIDGVTVGGKTQHNFTIGIGIAIH